MDSSVAQWGRTPGEGRYARPERERRFLVHGRPTGLRDPRRIHDRYLDGTRLRLRQVVVGSESVFKLTQKVRSDETDPGAVALTNMYLTSDEHERLSGLPGSLLTKTRHVCPSDPDTFVLDEFHGHLTGLRLLEVEVPDLTGDLALPSWAGPEVTHDDRFSGGYLAQADARQAAELLALARRQ